MAKAKNHKFKNGAPVPANFHPKDTPLGVVWRCGGIGVTPDMRRGTVHISVGGATAEMTIEAAKSFEQQLDCAINCASKGSVEGKTSE